MKDDGVAVEVSTESTISSEYSALLKSNNAAQRQDIASFLAKPVILSNGFLDIADTLTTNIYNQYMPKAYFTSSTMLTDKIRGLFAAKFTMVFTLQVNASRFQQGRYILAWIPLGGARPTAVGAQAWLSMHTASLRSRTQLPHVELDVATDTSVVLRVPYSSSLLSYPMASLTDPNQFGTLGCLRIFPYEPLVAASGITTAGFTLWAHIEDFDDFAVAVPQSGFKTVECDPQAQITPSTEELVANKAGPISSTLKTVSKASSLLKPLPLIGSYAGTLSWVTNILGGAAEVLGWSKPNNMAVVKRVQFNTVAYPSNFNAIDNSLPLSGMTDNSVSCLEGFSGSKTDELGVTAIAMRPSYIAKVSWGIASAAGAQLFGLEVAPFGDLSQRVDNGHSVVDLTPLQFAASNFRLWRGSIQYTVKIVKTEFHSGRLVVAFSPENWRTTIGAMSYANSNYLHREIIDIRTCNTFTITVPFVSTTPYKSTIPLAGTDFKVGGLFFYVLDPLMAPSTVASSITLLVEHSAGPDMEFALPESFYNLKPAFNVTPQSSFVTQASPTTNSEVVNIGNSNVEGTTTKYSEACIGERVMNFRQMLKKHNLFTAASVARPVGNVYTNILPFSWTAYDSALVPSPYTGLPRADLYGLLSSIFMYSRGGVNLKTPTNVTGFGAFFGSVSGYHVRSVSSGVPVYDSALALDGIATLSFGGQKPYVGTYNTKESYVEISQPMYSADPLRPNCDQMVATNGGVNTYRMEPGSFGARNFVTIQNNAPGASTSLDITRAGKDDATFGYFVSIPTMYYENLF